MRYADEHGYYELNPFPGCNQVVVSNHAFIYHSSRGKGYGQIQHKQRLANAANLGYNYIICTVLTANTREKHILEKNGWNLLDRFFNQETSNDVEFWGRSLDKRVDGVI